MSSLAWLIRGGGPWLLRMAIRFGIAFAVYWFVRYTPYDYTIGGECRIVPLAEQSVRAQVADEVTEVLVSKEQWLETGQPIVTLAMRDEIAEVAVLRARLAEAQANLDLLRNGATPEEIAVARNAVKSSEVRLDLAESNVERTDSLRENEAVAESIVEQAYQDLELARIQLASATEELTLLNTGSREEDIRAAEAIVRRYEGELAYQEQLVELGTIRAPIAGRVVTSNVRERRGHYVREGDLVCVIQDDSKLMAELAADEAAAMEVEVDMPVRIRLNSLNGELLEGRVDSVSMIVVNELEFDEEQTHTEREARNPIETGFESMRVTRIRVRFEEADPRIRAGMSGYGKVVIGQGLLWESLARRIQRFVYVEMWSWLP